MSSQVFNPYLPSWEYVPDGEPRVFGDRLYIYGSHDRFGGDDYCLNDYILWSAPLDDLSNWRNEGIIYRADQDPRNAEGKMHMCAPDCIRGMDGRYYLYYQLHMLQCTSVAVANDPAGPFEFYGYVQHPDGTLWGEKKGDTFAFDPGVLVDDDDKAYLYAGFAPKGLMKMVFLMRGNKVDGSVCLELDKDMKTVVGEEHPIVPGPVKAKGTAYDGHAFFEASSIRKVNGRYYYVYSSILSHELCYAVSDSPTGGFRYGGTIISIADLGYKGNTEAMNYTGNTHGGMAEVNGQWYIFYHRQTNQKKCCRQGCAERIQILSDGSIPQVEVTSCGLQNGPLVGNGRYEARIACWLSGRDGIISSDGADKKDKQHVYPYFTQSGGDREDAGDQYIANMQDGAWCAFKYFRFEEDAKRVKIQVRGEGSGVVEVSTGRDQAPAAGIKVSLTSEWQEFEADLAPLNGRYALFFTYRGSGRMDFSAFELCS